MSTALPAINGSLPGDSPSLTCAGCGCVSSLSTAFLWQHRNDNRRRPYCPRCVECHSASTQTSLLIAIGCLFLLGLLLPYEGLGFLLLTPAIGAAIHILLTPLHELAHAAFARMLGIPVYKIQIGWYGPLLFRGRVGRCEWQLRVPPVGGFVQPAFPKSRGFRWKNAFISSAGPLAEFAAVGVGLWLLVQVSESPWTQLLRNGLLVSLAWTVFINLYPRSVSTPAGNIPNDGLSMLSVCFIPKSEIEQGVAFYYYSECLSLLDRNRVDQAAAVCAEGLKRFENHLYLLMARGLCELERHQPAAAIQTFQSLLTHTDLTPEFEALLRANLAWASLLTGDAALLPAAVAESVRAFDVVPWRPEIRGTYGSTLIESGQVDDGIPHLLSAFRDNELREHRGWNAAYLALGYLHKGDLFTAARMYHAAVRLAPDCPLRSRLEDLMVNASGSESAGAERDGVLRRGEN